LKYNSADCRRVSAPTGSPQASSILEDFSEDSARKEMSVWHHVLLSSSNRE
jgi:hypothetical protein